MEQTLLPNLMLDQSKDLIWIVNKKYQLVYGNKTYFSFIKEINGAGKKLNDSAFIEEFGKADIQKWKTYYNRAIKGESFEIEVHFSPSNSDLGEINYYQNTFEPIYGNDEKVIAVSCRSRDHSEIIKERAAVKHLMDSSLDVFCSINEEGNFVHVSNASIEQWGYTPNELIGKHYLSLILEEDIAKTQESALSVIGGQDDNTFVNRFRKKDGGIAYNFWSSRWDSTSQLVICVARDGKKKIDQEERILQSEQRFKALVQDGSDLIGILNSEGNYIYVSPTSISILGIAPEEFIGENAFEFIHPEDLERTLATFQQTETKNKVILEPYRFLNSKKEWRWIETILTNMLDNPAVNGIVCNSRDITDRIEQDEKIEYNQKRFEALFENSMDCVIIISPEGETNYVSGSVKKILGYSPDEVMDLSIWELCHPDDLAGSAAALTKSLSHPGVPMKGHTSRIKHKDGSWRWIEPVITNLLHDPSVSGIVDNFRDVTDSVEEQQKLKLFESVITNTNDAVLITEAEPVDSPGPKIIYVNEAFTKMTGYEAEEVIGKSPRILQGPNSNKEDLAKLGQSLRNWEPCEITTINYKKSGEEFWINFTVTPVANEKGWYTHWIAIERDVTEQKKKELENELINSISGIFHESTDNNLTACLSVLCEHISKSGDFELAEVWLPAVDDKGINRVANYSKGKIGRVFYEETKEISSCTIGEGLPGEVWKNKTIEIWGSTEGKWLSKRKEAAKKAGIEAMMGVPLKHKDKVIGVLLLGTEKIKSTLGQYAELLGKLKVVIGSELSRKKIEIELAQIFDFTPDMICVAGFDGYIKRINPAGLEILGYSLEEIQSRPISSFVHEEDRLLTREKQMKLYGGQNLRNFENRYITKEGKIVWLSWTSTSSPEHNVVYAVAKNITEEKNLRELNRHAGRLAKIGSWEVDLVNQTVFWSEEVHQLHETDPNVYVPNVEAGFNFFRSDFREIVESNFGGCITEGKAFDFEAVLVTTSKKELWVRVIGNAEFVDGECKRSYGSIQDINDRKQAEIRLHALAGNLPGVVFQYFLYPDGTDDLKHITKRSAEVWGFQAEEVLQNNMLVWEGIQAGGEIESVRKSIALSIATETEWSARWKYVMPNGEMRTHAGYGSPNFLADGTVFFNSVILDVTEETKKEELLGQVTKQAKIGSWVTDLVGDEHYLSDVAYTILERELNETILDMESIINYCREDFRSMARSKLTKCIKRGSSFDFEVVIITEKKKEKWVRIIGNAEVLDGRSQKIFGSVQDINSLKETENRLTSFSENLPGVIYQYLIHPDGTDSMRYVSKGAKQLWGFTAKQVTENVNLLWDQLKVSNDNGQFRKSIEKAIETKSKWSGRFEYVMPTGELRTHVSRGVPLFLADGTIVCNVIVFDITQEVNNEKLLSQASQMARIGSWEKDLIQSDGDNVYWSPMVKDIMEVDDNYTPTFIGDLEFYIGESKERIKNAVNDLITRDVEFDLELLLRTAKGHERWVRSMGKSEITNNKRTKIYGSLQDIHISKTLELRISEILGSISDAFYAVDKDWKCTYFNKEAERIFNRKEKDVVGKDIWKLFPFLVGTKLDEVYHSVSENLEPESFEYQFGDIPKWYEISVYPSTGGLSVYLKNIDERKVAAAELQKAFEDKASILESIGDAFFTVDTQWIVTYWNKEAEFILGKTRDQIIGKHLWEEYADAIETDFYTKYHEAIETREATYFEALYPTMDKWFEVSAYPSDEGLSVYFKDTTLKKEALTQLQLANERFEKVTEATKDAIWDWDIVNQTYYRSNAIEKFFGKEASKSFNEEDFWQDNFHSEDLQLIQSSIEEALADSTCSRWELEYRLFNDEGNIRFVIDRGVIIRNEKGKAVRMVGAMTDVTQQKQMELELKNLNQELEQHALQLEQSNEELEQFAFVASHDLQEPLRMISSFMDLLKRKYEDQLDEKALKYIHFATDGASRMKEIILDLLDYSRAGKVHEEVVSIDLNQTLQDYMILRRRIVKDKKVQIVSNKLPFVNCYKVPLTQTIHCLLDNSIKYSREGVQPLIEINVTDNQHEWVVEIKDNGIGIDKQFFDKIFVIFQRLHNKDQYDGTGIGLAIAKKNVELCNGKIWVESVVNEGSTFYFTIKKIEI